MKFSATILTGYVDRDGDVTELLGIHADGQIPITRHFGALRNDRIGTASLNAITPGAARIDGEIGDDVPMPVRFADYEQPPALYAAPAGTVEAFEMREGVRVITKFRITEISLTTSHTDPRVPPIEVKR